MPERRAGRGAGFVRSFPARTLWFTRGSLIAAVAVLALAGCREAEQGRPLMPEKGVYGGTEDQKLDPETLDKLRQRGMRQNFT